MASNEWLVRKLHEQDKKIEALSRGGTGVGHSSIAPGENLTVISDNGEVVLGAGGVEHVDGPTPATPSAPTLKLGFGTIETTWDGTFAEGEDEDGVPVTAPVDFDVVEVHCSTDPEEEEWGEDTMRGQIKTREGGTITVGGFDVDDEVFVCLIALAKTGKRSAPSATASLIIEGLDFAQLTNELDAATVTIDNAREVLLDGQNTLGEKLDAADTALSGLETTLGELDSTTLPALRNDLDAAEGRLDTAEGQITDAFGELDAVPGQIADAKQAAIDAAALDATGKADAAQSAAEEKAALAQQAADDALAAINAGESMWADPGFESSFGPLGSTNPAVVRSDAFAYQGAWSVEYTTTGTGANVYPGYVTVPVTAGRTYRLSAAVRSDDGLAFESFFEQRAGGSTVVGSPKLEIAGGVGSFALGDATQTIVDGVTELRFAPLVPAAHNNVAGKKLYLDNFTLTDITESWAMFQEAMTAASDAQTVAGEAKAIAEAAVGAAEGGNTNFFNQSEPSGVGSLVGDRWFQRTATWAITGMWMWDGSNWIRQTLNNEVIGNLDAGKITFGYMNGERIEAGSIYADRIVSGLSQNMVPDPGFVSPEINASRLLNNSSFGGTWDIADGVLSCDTNGGTMTNNSNFPLAATSDREAWSAYPGMTMVHRFSARVVGGSATVRGTAYTLRRDGTKSYTALTPSAFIPITDTWQEYSFSTALGDDITSYSTALQVGRTSTGVVEFKAPFSASMVGTTVIEGGAVTTNKLAANVLEVGNLKAGTAAIAEAVVAKIAAQTASIQQADVKNLFVTGTSSLSDVVAERIAAETAEFIELEVGNLVAGTGTMDTATINKLFTDVVVASMAQAQEFIGENAILTGAVTAPKITASEELWAKIGQFVQIRAEHIEADAIDGMVITGATIRSAATGARTLMSASGFEAYDNAGKRTFFASASTGNVSMTGELYTGESGSERVVLDNSLWNSVAVVDPETGTQTNVPGAGVRIGVSSSSGADIYHGATPASGGRYVDQAVFRGPSGRARTVYGSASAGGGFPASSHVLSIADDNSGVVAAECRVTSSGIGSATRKVELIGADANGNSRALIRASGGNGKSNMWGLDANGIETSEVASDGPNRSAWMGGKDSSGALTAYVASFGNAGTTDISGSNQNPLNVNYTGTSDWWVVPFKKGGTSWGYVGSSGAMGVDEFGVQSASGKNLVLTTTTGSAGIVAKTNGDVTFSESLGVNFKNIPTSNGTGVNVTAGGWFQKNTSSLRYKTDVELADVSGFDVLSLEPKSFVYKDQKARFEKPREEWGDYENEIFANGLTPSYGLIAEEVEEAGGTFAVNYDTEGMPDSINYGLIGVALIPIIRDLRNRIEELERGSQ